MTDNFLSCEQCGREWNPKAYVGDDPNVCPYCNKIEQKEYWTTPGQFPLFALSMLDEVTADRIRPETATLMDASLRPVRYEVKEAWKKLHPNEPFTVQEAAAFVKTMLPDLTYEASLACPIQGFLHLVRHRVCTGNERLTKQERTNFEGLHASWGNEQPQSYGWNWGDGDTSWFIERFELVNQEQAGSLSTDAPISQLKPPVEPIDPPDEPINIAKLMQETPSQDKKPDEWILQSAMASFLGIKTKTLNNRRHERSVTVDDKSEGAFYGGALIWTKRGKKQPRYHLPTAKRNAGQLAEKCPKVDFEKHKIAAR